MNFWKTLKVGCARLTQSSSTELMVNGFPMAKGFSEVLSVAEAISSSGKLYAKAA